MFSSRMRMSHCVLCCSALLIVFEREATAQVGWSATQTVPANTFVPTGLPIAEIEGLVAPIALYPDVLVSQILPASTFPIEIVKAARWLRGNPNLSTLAAQQWEPSVASLSHYPQVLYMLDNDLDWTNALGAAFLDQTVDVMDAIQRLRARANASGALLTTNQHTVVVERETIRIVPTQPDVVYVPQYDTRVVYVDRRDSRWVSAAIGFSTGLALGSWLDLDFDWRHRRVHYVRPGYWAGWGHRGVVTYGSNWGVGIGHDRGFFGRPHGGVAWNNGYGNVWRRPAIRGRPIYTGRYSAFSRRASGYNRIRQQRPSSSSRWSNIRNTRSIDRGRRQRDSQRRPNSAGRSRQGNQRSQGNQTRRGTQRSRSAYGNRSQGRDANRYGQRGHKSRDVQRGQRKSNKVRGDDSRRNKTRRGDSNKKRSSYGDRRGRSSVDRSSERGKKSRAGSGRRRSGQDKSGRRGGGRRGGERREGR